MEKINTLVLLLFRLATCGPLEDPWIELNSMMIGLAKEEKGGRKAQELSKRKEKKQEGPEAEQERQN